MLRRYLMNLITAVIALVVLIVVSAVMSAFAQEGAFQRGVRAYSEGDVEAAVSHWREAADDSHAGAAFLLANLYAGDATGETRHALAFRYYLQAAEAGHGEAQVALFNYYRRGNEQAGVEVDLAQAHHWLSQAAGGRNAHAQYLLGDMHTQGEGVEKNPHRGLRWFLLAADKQYALALARLAWIYAEGEIVTSDPAKGFMYMNLAVEEARGRERAAIKSQHERMLADVAPEARRRGLEMAAEWRAERQALRH